MSECPNRKELFHHINEVSFAVDDIKLYLDTHPCDDEAMECFEEYSQLRNEALKEYAKHFKDKYGKTGIPRLYAKWDKYMDYNWRLCIKRCSTLQKRLLAD